MRLSSLPFWRSLLACWSVLWLTTWCAPSLAAAPQTLLFEHIDIEQGMSSASVTTVLQDRQGFMWIGTQAGLNRFDGYRFTQYKNDPRDATSLSDNWVTALYEDANGQLWIGTRGGLQHYDAVHDHFVGHMPQESAARNVGNMHVTAIIGEWPGSKEKKNGVWLSTIDGLKHFDADSGTFKAWRNDPKQPESLFSNRANSLAWDAQGNLWIGRSKGLDRLAAGDMASGRFAHLSTDDVTVFALLAGTGNTLWVGTHLGLEQWTLGRQTPERSKVKAGENELGWVLCLMQDRDGVLWIGTESNGLFRYDPRRNSAQAGAETGALTAFRREQKDAQSLSSNSVYSLDQDRNGSLWVGTWTGGISRTDLASGGFSRYDHLVGDPKSADDDRINAIAGDAANRLWLGTADGLARLEQTSGALEVFRHEAGNPNSLPNNWVQTIFIARNRQMWIGTKDGLAAFDPATRRFANHRFNTSELLGNWIYRVQEEDDGSLWVATLAGLYRFNPVDGSVQGYRHKQDDVHSLADDRVTSVLKDREGRLWVGTLSGLDRLDVKTGRFAHIRHNPNDPSSLSGDGIINMHQDMKGRFWIATTSGLNRLETDADGPSGKFSFDTYSRKEGLEGEPVGSILEDKLGRLWIGTTAGISRLDPSNGVIKEFTARDGLLGGTYLWCSSAIGADGTFYFGNLIGLTAFHPEAIRENPTSPVVVMTDLQVFNRSVRGSNRPRGVAFEGTIGTAKTLTLSPANSVFSIEFAALHYSDPAHNQYAYQLEGFDRDWVHTDATRRLATYTNLDPGHYTFRVKAANKSGIWNEESAALDVIITPPFWKTWWFRLLCLLLVVGSAWVTYQARILSLMRHRELLEQQVSIRTAEVVQQKDFLQREKAEVERQRSETERQKESVERAHRNISLLSEIGREITATLDREKIIDSVHRHVHQLMYLDTFCIGTLRDMQRVIQFPFCEDQGKRVSQPSISLDDGTQLEAWCVAHRKEVFINDMERQYEDYTDGPSPQEQPGASASLPKHMSVICVPMLAKDKVLGVIAVKAFRKDTYHRVHLDMLMSLAAYAAVALDNADAYRQLQETQQQLVSQEKMAALGLLVAGVAHELNTPIGNSLLIASAMVDEADTIKLQLAEKSILRSELNSFFGKAKDAASLIVRSLTSAANLVNSFKQVAVDRTTEQRRAFDLRQVSQEIVATMMSRVRKMNHSITLDIPEAIVMNSYPGPYGQVVTNCINNALLHAFDGRENGRMTLSAEMTSEDWVRIKFSDNGIGISEENLKRIFDPFFTTRLGQGGNGLGLSISFNIVNSLLGGTVSVQSRWGQGTVFMFDLPLAAPEAER